MRSTFLLWSVLFVPFFSLAQITPRLQQSLEEQPEGQHSILVEMKAKVDHRALKREMELLELPVSERPRWVIEALQETATPAQAELLAYLRTQPSTAVAELHSFWITNILLMRADNPTVHWLSQREEVARIDLVEGTILPHDPIIKESGTHEKAPNGVEPGLTAINAPAMWQLGYTGRGRSVYNYDTGVWPTHPAFANRFLGHRSPIDQAWYGHFSNTPNGNVSDHGTHVLGTIAGLVEETNDTIGVAFGSYWIANDLVTSTVEALPALANMIAAFEWALNPDGDINTSNDVPDVINNSWRWRDEPDTVQCGGFIVELMNTIEAAGIANVFSGGNSGPNNTAVNAPQRINTSEVNTFCVGSVNANLDFPHPISPFSTRGPTQCPADGNSALEIHPEVVAPGQNVRSAWGMDGFNSISGTSMSAPHVSGAVLLLKEAFPYLTGEDLLRALYETAIDMGDPGEDNIYGRGLIDVHAAYEHLSLLHTPVPPVAFYDVSISGSSHLEPLTCEDAFSVNVEISNLGSETVDSLIFSYGFTGESQQDHLWTGSLTTGASAVISLPEISTSTSGPLELTVRAALPNGQNEYDEFNNSWVFRTFKVGDWEFPFVEDFEHGFAQNDWFIKNDDQQDTWSILETAGNGWGPNAATMQLYQYGPRNNQRDELIGQHLQLPESEESLMLLFDVAYQQRSSSTSLQDTLMVMASADCGQSFTDTVYLKSGESLSTTDTVTLDFIPEHPWHWRTDTVPLDAFSGQRVLFQWQTVNRRSNNLYVDNIRFFSGNEPTSIREETLERPRLFPNPTSGHVTVEWSTDVYVTDAVVFNLLGRFFPTEMEIEEQRLQFDASHLAAGMYIIGIETTTGRDHIRFLKE